MAVHLGSRNVRAHRFVLAARSDNWGVPSLADVDSLGKVSIAQHFLYGTVHVYGKIASLI